MIAPQKMEAVGYDPNMGGLDLSGFPHLTPLHDESFIDDRFAQMDRSTNGSAELKAFLAEQVNERTPTSIVHAGESQFKVFYRDGAWHADGVVDGTRRRYSDRNRDGLLSKLGQITKPQDTFRTLTKDQELQVIRACQSGDKATAIGIYLAFAIGEARASRYSGPIEMMHDAALIPVMNDCALFCWYHSHPHVMDTPDWSAYRDRVLGDRPITFDLLDAAWMRYQAYLEDRPAPQPQPEFEEPGDTPREALEKLNALDDNEVDKLMQSARQQYAREVRAGRR
jgi:hypothetical protein